MAIPGILYVSMQPQDVLPMAHFHDWYNNEHGPTRLKIPQIFSSGLRYRACDGKQPGFLAVYDVTCMTHLETATYTSLRANRSPREATTVAQVHVERHLFDLLSTEQSPFFRPIQHLPSNEAEGLVLMAVSITLKSEGGGEKELLKWHHEEYFPMLSRAPGWLRTRCFRTSSIESAGQVTYLFLHDCKGESGLGGREHKATMPIPWGDKVMPKWVEPKERRAYELFYVFGPAPSDLFSLSKLAAGTPAFTSLDGNTSTIPGNCPVIQSCVTTRDGLVIPYRLEGNTDPKAPTIAFSNSLLTSLHMWDPFLDMVKKRRPEFRFVRYDTRGRHAIPQPPIPANLNMLADDLSCVLDGLRIMKLDALVGVSMGGATSLKFALKNPNRVSKLIACDFNIASSPTNTDAWKSRIQVADTPTQHGKPGIITLAHMTVERWYHPESLKKACRPWMVEMVAANDVEGFRYSVQALWNYDMKPQARECTVPALLVVGEADGRGALVKAMDGFKGSFGKQDVSLNIVPEAGHLPMCENPEGFWNAVKDFL